MPLAARARPGKRIWSDPELRLGLRICARGPTPHSIFLGRPLPAPGEPLWLPEDTDKALAYELAMQEACPECGRRREDFFDEDGELHDPPLYEPVVHDCYGCAEKARLQAALADEAIAAYGGADDPKAAGMARRSLAGAYVVIRRFDPRSGVARAD
jgi:hypothetical protein